MRTNIVYYLTKLNISPNTVSWMFENVFILTGNYGYEMI